MTDTSNHVWRQLESRFGFQRHTCASCGCIRKRESNFGGTFPKTTYFTREGIYSERAPVCEGVEA